ncbi:MAG TPA: maltose ABC transporter permease MalF [Rhizobacter sp.]|nr:maltose ABC transporter permease MalF [Rhizobacter sp.]
MHSTAALAMTSPAKKTAPRWVGPLVLGVLLLAALYIVVMVHAAGETLLAGTILFITALAAWLYTSPRFYAYRYLFPGIAAAMVFVVFPMLYTIGIGFTNHSSSNLLSFQRATQYHLDETVAAEGAPLAFTLHADGPEFRVRLQDPDSDAAWVSGPLALKSTAPLKLQVEPIAQVKLPLGEPLPLRDVIQRQAALKALSFELPDRRKVVMTGLRQFSGLEPVYEQREPGVLANRRTGELLKANPRTGFYENAAGQPVPPGYQVGVGFDNYRRIFTEPAFREPFFRIFLWTVAFAALTVLGAGSLGMLLAVLLNWDALRFRSVYRVLLFLPYAVPGFISILVFRGLFNNNFGEINLILDALFGIRPTWFSDPTLAKAMLLIVNVWLGYPYMMLVCMGLIRAIPADLYEASAVAGAGPLTNFFRITVPLVIKPLTPLLIAAFAFNFNNFVLISLLTGGRPDFLDTSVPAGTTDLLVSYTYRIAFEDSGQQFGLAAAISTVIFLLVAAISLVQIRFTRIARDTAR